MACPIAIGYAPRTEDGMETLPGKRVRKGRTGPAAERG